MLFASAKFGSSLFHLSAHNQLMFWGGEYEQEIELYRARRQVNLEQNFLSNRNINDTTQIQKPLLRIKVEGAMPLQSK